MEVEPGIEQRAGTIVQPQLQIADVRRTRSAGDHVVSRVEREIERIQEGSRSERIGRRCDSRREGTQIEGVAGRLGLGRPHHSRCRDHYQQMFEQLHVLSSRGKFRVRRFRVWPIRRAVAYQGIPAN